MDDKQEVMPIISNLLRNFSSVFTLVFLGMSITGMLVSRLDQTAQETSTLFALGRAGLPYNSILQITLLSFILALCSMFLFSERFNNTMRFLTRFSLLLLATFLITSIFVIIFKWFPVNSLMSWLFFVLAFVVCNAIVAPITLLYLKKEGKKYNNLLANYKARHNVK
jgi:Mg2+ and Co2+ transporter CorA